MSKGFTKLLLSFLTGIVLLISMAPANLAMAQNPPQGGAQKPKADPAAAANQPSSPWYSQDPLQWYGKVYGGDPGQIFGERYTAAQVQWVFYGFVFGFLNYFPGVKQCLLTMANGDASTCASTPPVTPTKTTGDSGKSRSLVAVIFEDRELSGITYVKNIGRKFNLIPQAKAQGFGYSGALALGGSGNNTIQKAWQAIRDLSYGIFVVIIIAFAFMIMFRVKISPQVVISVQSALPKIAVALILVTFSYAIAGFLIDIMYVCIGIFSLVFSQFTVAGVGFQGGAPAAVTGYFDLLTIGPTFLGIKQISTGIFGLLVMYIVNYVIAFADIVFSGLLSIFRGIPIAAAGGGIQIALGEPFLAVLTFIIGVIGLVVVIVMSLNSQKGLDRKSPRLNSSHQIIS